MISNQQEKLPDEVAVAVHLLLAGWLMVWTDQETVAEHSLVAAAAAAG